MRKLVLLAAVAVALSARAEQKNVQLLKGMSDLQLQRTMNMMRASLGVHCDFCHVVEEKTGWNFPSDAKKEKKEAREMIAMTLKLNKEQFGGKVEVSCWTCHRGTTHPASLATLPQPAPPFPTPKATRPALPALEEVVKKYAAALGDISKLTRPRRMKGTRESFDGKQVPIEVLQSGSRVHITADAQGGGKLVQVVTESGGWSKDQTGVQDFGATGLENFRELASTLELTLPADIPPDARVTGKETIGYAEVVIVTYRKGGLRHRLYFSQTTDLLLRRVTIRETPIGELPQQTDFDDWRDFGGTRFPQTVRTSLVDPWAGSTRRYSEVTLDVKIDDTVFAKPK
jgi:photosynthetic reaction center cytochrome c subunit